MTFASGVGHPGCTDPPCRGITAQRLDVRSGRRSGDRGEGLGDRRACLRLPALDLQTERIVSVIDDRADLRRVPQRDHQLELGRAEIPQLLDRLRNFRLDDLGFSDPAETLAEQGLDGLDAGAVVGEISCRKPLPHSGQVQVAQVSRVVLVAASSSTRRIVSTSSAAVSASAGRTADGELDEPVLSSNGSDSAITGRRCRAFRVFVWSPFATAADPSSAARAEW